MVPKKKEINVHIGIGIKAARERANLTQEQFGELVSLGSKNVSDIERGVVGITISTLKNICEKLCISSDSIIFYNQDKNDIEFLSDRLKRLRPEHFKWVSDLLNQVFLFLARLGQ